MQQITHPVQFQDNDQSLKTKKMNENPPHHNQIYLVTLRPTQLTQASFLQENQMLQNVVFDIFNTDIAQCCQKLDVILGTKVVQF